MLVSLLVVIWPIATKGLLRIAYLMESGDNPYQRDSAASETMMTERNKMKTTSEAVPAEDAIPKMATITNSRIGRIS